ncbi:MarR family winged helix-turn-helix transcriptional regulator [Caviibacterium pharyngocola]|uniref:MarR family transcriptional regulator n=1 Tax=Caviibacterium pharyngocola TaxID=28159 RepID=A0A2M8RTQ5_9PAST|nr:MarR family winged helix-turn-helix transcriptional regulator [Caviibacterium pharyngocola]PJG82268.1 MarR family transcriptional regulator [Caviibacterium pharyngocola]
MSLFEEFEQHIMKIESNIDSWISKLGLSYNHFAVLYSLMYSEEKNDLCTQKKICDEWYIPKQTVFNICKEYREKGWIEFAESAQDKREKILRLTDIGREYAKPIYQMSSQLSDKIFAKFGKRKTAQLFALLTELDELCKTEIDKIERKNENPI